MGHFPMRQYCHQRFSRNIQTIFVQQPSPPQLQHLLTPRSLRNVHWSKAHGVLSCSRAGASRGPCHVRSCVLLVPSRMMLFCLEKSMCPSHMGCIYIWGSEYIEICHRNFTSLELLEHKVQKDTLSKSADNRDFFRRIFFCPQKNISTSIENCFFLILILFCK